MEPSTFRQCYPTSSYQGENSGNLPIGQDRNRVDSHDPTENNPNLTGDSFDPTRKVDNHKHLEGLEAFFRMFAHAYDCSNPLAIDPPLSAGQITDIVSQEGAFSKVWPDSENNTITFGNYQHTIFKVHTSKLKKECIEHMKNTIRSSYNFLIPALWNDGRILDRGIAYSVDTSTLVAHMNLLSMKQHETRVYDSFIIRKASNEVRFINNSRGLSIKDGICEDVNKYQIMLRGSSGTTIKDPFEITYALNVMYFAIRSYFLMNFRCGVWQTNQTSLLRNFDIFISDAFPISSMHLISNIHSYTINDIKDLNVWCFDLPSMELYHTSYFTIRESLPRLLALTISQLPKIEGLFISMYKYMYGGYDNFLTTHEIDTYKTLGKILYICICHGISLDKHSSYYLIRSLLIFDITELIDSRSISCKSQRKLLCQRLFEIHRYDIFKQRGVEEIMHNDVSKFQYVEYCDILNLVDTFFSSTDWWAVMRLSRDRSDLRHILISQCWAHMQTSIQALIWQEYDQFLDPIYTIARSLTLLVLGNESSSPNLSIVEYKDSIERLDLQVSRVPFPMDVFQTEFFKIQSILTDQIPDSFQIRKGTSIFAIDKKADWLNDAMAQDHQLHCDMWQFIASDTGQQYVTMCAAETDIGRMLYASPCANKIYVSPKFYTFDVSKHIWQSVNAPDAGHEAQYRIDFIQSVKDSIRWSTGYPSKDILTTIKSNR